MRLQHFIAAYLNPQHNEPQCLDHYVIIPFGMKIMFDCHISYGLLPSCYNMPNATIPENVIHYGENFICWSSEFVLFPKYYYQLGPRVVLESGWLLSWWRNFQCLWDLNCCYILPQSPPFIHIRNQLDPVQPFTHNLSKIRFYILQSTPRSPKWAHLCRFFDKNCLCISHFPVFSCPNIIGEEYTLWGLLRNFSII